jgi:hypothetical protein
MSTRKILTLTSPEESLRSIASSSRAPASGDTINKVTDYVHTLGVQDMDFRDITPAFISGLTTYLQSLPNQGSRRSILSLTYLICFSRESANINPAPGD